MKTKGCVSQRQQTHKHPQQICDTIKHKLSLFSLILCYPHKNTSRWGNSNYICYPTQRRHSHRGGSHSFYWKSLIYTHSSTSYFIFIHKDEKVCGCIATKTDKDNQTKLSEGKKKEHNKKKEEGTEYIKNSIVINPLCWSSESVVDVECHT
jgi:hypothetical protein